MPLSLPAIRSSVLANQDTSNAPNVEPIRQNSKNAYLAIAVRSGAMIYGVAKNRMMAVGTVAGMDVRKPRANRDNNSSQ
jgi:hypothetical protein